MAYRFDLEDGQSVYLDHQAGQTVLTILMVRPGQQQQSSSSFQTGDWTAPPQGFRTSTGVMLQLHTTRGEVWLQVQGNSIQVAQPPSSSSTHPLPMQEVESTPGMAPLPPLKPMQPMQMGNMSMSMNPMEMRMGEMEMRMGTSATTRFCRQCGSSIQPDDRFCSKCGTRLK